MGHMGYEVRFMEGRWRWRLNSTLLQAEGGGNRGGGTCTSSPVWPGSGRLWDTSDPCWQKTLEPACWPPLDRSRQPGSTVWTARLGGVSPCLPHYPGLSPAQTAGSLQHPAPVVASSFLPASSPSILILGPGWLPDNPRSLRRRLHPFPSWSWCSPPFVLMPVLWEKSGVQAGGAAEIKVGL